MVGRIQTYTHSDSITPNKGAAVVKVECDTDFAARTGGFIAFAETVAKYSYGACAQMVDKSSHGTGADAWETIVIIFPDLEELRVKLEKELKEKIRVTEIVILRL